MSVDFDVLAGDLGELADLDVLTEQGGGLFDSSLTVVSPALASSSSSAELASASTA